MDQQNFMTFNPQMMLQPSQEQIDSSQISQFRLTINYKFNLNLRDYNDLYQWSIENIESFWEQIWVYFQIKSSSSYDKVLEHQVIQDIPQWFQGAKLNYAENLLKWNDDHVAIISTAESFQWEKSLTYKQLRESVESFALKLKSFGVKKGDCVVAYAPNCVETVVAFLACASLGAIWSSASCDFGISGVLDRFSQINPKVLISVNAVTYNGKIHSNLSKLVEISNGLTSLQQIVIIDFVQSQSCELIGIDKGKQIYYWKDCFDMKSEDFLYEQVEFGHPLYVLYSSGTTGKPKCITHGHGGPLLQHLKEHVLHSNMSRDDVFFQFTTVGWMMWNWLVGALSVGCTIVLYDGSPFIPDSYAMFRLCEKYKVTRFGTSAKFIQSCQDLKVFPSQLIQLPCLKTIFSTGSPLLPHNYDFIYQHIKSGIQIGSITGGTDIVSLFAGNCCILPLYKGEIQCRALGMAVESWAHKDEVEFSEEGKKFAKINYISPDIVSVQGASGDLVCVKPFPCMPVKFWGDDDKNSKYVDAYFSQYKNVWYHGDYIWINPVTGGIVMNGRSDGILKPAGVRFGSAELYNIVEKFYKIEISDSLAIGQRRPGDTDERVILFLKMNQGQILTDELKSKIKSNIRQELSPRHVPALIIPIAEIPYTVNGKKVEIAVKKILSGQKVVASGTLSNPDCLKLYENIPELQ